MLAVSWGRPEVVRILLESGADVSATHANGETIMNRGIRSGNFEIAKLLLDAEPSRIDIPDSNGQAPLFMAAGGGYEKLVDNLISAGAMLDRIDYGGKTALMVATILGHRKCVESLLRVGADASKVDSRGYDALRHAAQEGFVEIVEIFVRGGGAADINKVYSKGGSLLMLASINGCLEVVKFLLRIGADPFVTRPSGITAFNLTEDLAVFKLLLKGHEPQAAAFVDTKGNTLFHHTVEVDGSAGFMCLLYKAGLDPRIKNERGLTAADVARLRGQVETAKLLDLFEAKYREKESVGSTAVAASCAAGEGVVEADDSLDGKDNDSIKSSRNKVQMPNMQNNADEKAGASTTSISSVSVEGSEDAKVKRRHRKVQPCLHCHMSTHRRCARCRTAYICSHDCQVATMADHRSTCMEIYEERQAKQTARIEK